MTVSDGSMQHIFIDVEAYGPPGIGRPFALGAAKFDMERGVYATFQRSIAWPNILLRQLSRTRRRWPGFTNRVTRYLSRCTAGAIVRAADPLQVYSEEKYGELVPHIAEHDAVRGALDLIAALGSAPSRWRKNLGFGQ